MELKVNAKRADYTVFTVGATRPGDTRGVIRAGGWRAPCTLGPAGRRLFKREGDGATPIGLWPIHHVLYRADRIGRPQTQLPLIPIDALDGWCDDPASRHYNRPVALPFADHAEKLWRADHVYDVIVVIGHNDSPPVPGRGSAIFVHLAHEDFRPTEGCIGLGLRDMRRLLAWCGPRSFIRVAV